MSDGPSPRDFLLLQDRPIQKPLQDWAAEIIQAVEADNPEDPESHTRLSTCLNLGALVEVFRGQFANAHRLCDAHLMWLARLACMHEDRVGVLLLAFQPWVNQGRLYRLEARLDDALRHFSIVTDHAAGQSLVFGPCTITGEIWEVIMDRDPSVLAVLSNVYLVDSLKAYFRCKSYESALEFVAKHRSTAVRAAPDLLLEAEILSLVGLRRFDQVQVLAASYSGSSVLGNLIFMLHQAASLFALGSADESLAITKELAEFTRLGGLDSFSSPTVMRYLSFLGRLLDALEAAEPARAIYEKGRTVAYGAADQPFRVFFLNALSRFGSPEERKRWDDERVRVLDECYYNNVRSVEGACQPRDNAVFKDLMSCLLGLTGDVTWNPRVVGRA